MPHEFLIDVYQGKGISQTVVSEKGKPTIVEVFASFQERIDAAKAAAPFIVPRLSAQAVELNATVTDYSNLPADQLKAKLAESRKRLAALMPADDDE